MREFTLDVFPQVAIPDEVRRVLAAVREERLTHLTDPQLTSLVSCVVEAEAGGREGLGWSGCRKAVEEYVADHPELRLERRAKIHLVRR